MVHGYMELWKWPAKVHDAALPEAFSKKRAAASRKGKHLKCSASDGLSMYPVLAYFVQTVLLRSGKATKACEAFLALADVIDLLVAVPLGVVTPAALRSSIAGFLQLCISAGWRKIMHPKFHWMVHLPRHLAQWGMLPTCWVHERRHKVIKRYATDVRNTRSFEKSIMKEVCAHHFHELEEEHVLSSAPRLLNPRPCPPEVRQAVEGALGCQGANLGCSVSSRARVTVRCACDKGDVVLMHGAPGEPPLSAGRVRLFVSYAGELVVLVDLWGNVKSDPETGAAEWQVQPHASLVAFSDILLAVPYTTPRHGIVRTLVPCDLRRLLR